MDEPWFSKQPCTACQGPIMVALMQGNFVPAKVDGVVHAQGKCANCSQCVFVALRDLVNPNEI